MADEHTNIMWGLVITALAALYGFFLKHVVGHVSKDVQYKDNCAEIVKRFDANQKDMNAKLDRLLDYHMEK